MVEIRVPQINANDVEVLVAWRVNPWTRVELGQVICSLETTKAVFELESPSTGYLYYTVENESTVRVGDVLAYIFPSDDRTQVTRSHLNTIIMSGRTFSRKAEALMRDSGLIVDDMPGTGAIREQDVMQVLDKRRLIREDSRIKALSFQPHDIAIYGTGSHGVVAFDCCTASGYRPTVFFDYAPRDETMLGIPIFHIGLAPMLYTRGLMAVYICLPTLQEERAAAVQFESIGIQLHSLVHPTASVSPLAKLGKNIFVGPQCVIGPLVELGDFSRVLNGASVAHHSRTGCGVHISDGARIAGNVTVGENTLVGLGATINLRLTVGRAVTVVSGASVYDNVPDAHTVRRDGSVHPLATRTG